MKNRSVGVHLVGILGILVLVLGAKAFYIPQDSKNFDQLNRILINAIRVLERNKNMEMQKSITGQVNLRPPRSDVSGDMVRLYQLQELDRMIGSKARPRFGKRGDSLDAGQPAFYFSDNSTGGDSGEEVVQRR